MYDSSDYAVGVILGQHVDRKSHVIYYANHTLNDAQLNYTITEKEFLAVIFGFEKFRPYLRSHVIVYIDHYAINHLALQKFDDKVRDKKGVADHLYRILCDRESEFSIVECFPNKQLYMLSTLIIGMMSL